MNGPLPESVVDRVLALNRALTAAGLPFAFGGAIALGYATAEPRMTRDVAVNAFVDAADAARVLSALPPELDADDALCRILERDGQARIQAGMFPVDLFLDNMQLHREAAGRGRAVPFAGTTIPVLSALDIVVFKAMFDRTGDWADIKAVFAAQAVSLRDAQREIAALVGDADHRVARLREAAEAARVSRTIDVD